MPTRFHSAILGRVLSSFIMFAVGCSRGPTTSSDVFDDRAVCELAEAAGRGDVREIDRLAAAGVDLNAVGKDGVTPLVWAMTKRNHDGFLRLLERGADPNQKHRGMNRYGSAMGAAAASELDDPFYLDSLLKHGGNPNLRESAGKRGDHEVFQTPLAAAAIYSGSIKNLDLLIHAGADLNSKGGLFGSTPLMEAALQNWYEGVYYLLQAGADFNIKDDDGNSIADLAVREPVAYTQDVRRWKDKVLDFLEKKGVDLQAVRKRQESMGNRTKKLQPGETARANSDTP